MPNDDATAFRRVELLPLDGLKANKRNPKAHDLDTIDASVSRFGVIDPIVLDSRTGTIISGHGRAAALRAMKQRGESPPDGVQETPDGEWLVPVATGWASRTDTEANAALIALNRTTELGGWVDEKLLELLGDLSELGDDAFLGVGFNDDDREALERLHYDFETDGPRDLDDLYSQVGDPTPEDKYRKVILELPPELALALEKALGTGEDRVAAARGWLEFLAGEQ